MGSHIGLTAGIHSLLPCYAPDEFPKHLGMIGRAEG